MLLAEGCGNTNAKPHPLGSNYIAAEYYKSDGENCFITYKKRLIEKFNTLGIWNMPTVTTLCQLSAYVNLEYTLPNGEKIKLLDDTKIYISYQVEKANSDRCYRLVADNNHLLVCEYGCNGEKPEIIVFKKRESNSGL